MGIYTKVIDLQKLGKSWERVRQNKSAAGTDHITCEDFEGKKREYLQQLHLDLKNKTYKPQPVKLITIIKNEKTRQIALFSMRDKVLQQSIHGELQKIYEPIFSSRSYAYRPGKSALVASKEIETYLKVHPDYWIVKTDIRHFFDNISLETLLKFLHQRIRDEEAEQLIKTCIYTRQVDEDGVIEKKIVGIYQGSILSPLLSNIYMEGFDKKFAGTGVFYLRYSDDLLIIAKDEEEAKGKYEQVEEALKELKLSAKQEKTKICAIADGFDFLGYHFDSSGKSIPIKADMELSARLENLWLDGSYKNLEERLKKGTEIVRGWKQYYGSKIRCSSIYEYIVRVDMARKEGSSNYLTQLAKNRSEITNIHKDIVKYLDNLWVELKQPQLSLLEYEQYYEIAYNDKEVNPDNRYFSLLLADYRKFFISETKELALELMQLYSDMKCYGKAASFRKMQLPETILPVTTVEVETSKVEEKVKQESSKIQNDTISWSEEELQTYLEIFSGREDLYAVETLNFQGKRCYQMTKEPLTEKEIHSHLLGRKTIGTYLQRLNGTVHYMVLDIDISRKILIQHQLEPEIIEQYREIARRQVQSIIKIYKNLGLTSYIEDSGYRGYHLWVFFEQWIPVRYVTMFQQIFERILGKTQEGIVVEYFPNKVRVREDKAGQVIKLPLGIHTKSGKKSYFVDENFQKVLIKELILNGHATYSLENLKRIIAKNSKEEVVEHKPKAVELDLSVFGKLDKNVEAVLTNCTLMQFLCSKAVKTGYLMHGERLSILYVFGHIGDAGKEFIHQIMAYTLNYQYNSTEKFIRKIPDKPISCIKLREQYRQITAEFGCSCNFHRMKNCYPSPVLHAIKNGDDLEEEVTLPTSRPMSQEKEREVIGELNIHKKVQETATKLLELKKQQRGMNKNIKKYELELEQIFNAHQIDCLEIEMGLLVRRKVENEYEWIIEI